MRKEKYLMAGNKQPPLDPPIKIGPDDDLATELMKAGFDVAYDEHSGSLFFGKPGSNFPKSADVYELQTVNDHYAIIPKPSEIKEYLDLFVIGQESAKEAVSVALCNHLYRTVFNTIEMGDAKNADKRIKKSNLMFIGDSGVGKTYIIELACKFLGIPFILVDATRFSAAGYVGSNVEEILTLLYLKAGRNLVDAQEGIVFIDEFDKLAQSSSNDKDVNTAQVQFGLLKMVEGCSMNVPRGSGHHSGDIDFDTTETLFVFSGSFGGMSSKKSAGPENSFGFLGESRTHVPEITEEDILKYGIIPEILGRIGHYIQLQALTEEQLKLILINPNNGPVEQAKKMFKLRFPKKKFPLTDKDYSDIIKKAIESKLGARGLAREVQQRMVKHYYE